MPVLPLVAQEPLDALEADGAVFGGGRGYLRGREHLRYAAHTSLLWSVQGYIPAWTTVAVADEMHLLVQAPCHAHPTLATPATWT